jgi:hypothetical protein
VRVRPASLSIWSRHASPLIHNPCAVRHMATGLCGPCWYPLTLYMGSIKATYLGHSVRELTYSIIRYSSNTRQMRCASHVSAYLDQLTPHTMSDSFESRGKISLKFYNDRTSTYEELSLIKSSGTYYLTQVNDSPIQN